MIPIRLKQRLLGLITALILISSLPPMAMANDKDELLRRTMADISLLNSQMAQRKADAAGIRDTLTQRIKEIENEIRERMGEKGIKTRADALDDPRIFHDLMLIAEIRAYRERFAEKIAYYRVACDRLGYLYQQADDDLKIVTTLSDLKIDALISQAEKVLDGYLSDAQTLVIQPGKLVIEPPQKVWSTLKTDG